MCESSEEFVPDVKLVVGTQVRYTDPRLTGNEDPVRLKTCVVSRSDAHAVTQRKRIRLLLIEREVEPGRDIVCSIACR